MFRWLKKFLRIITILLPSFVGVVFFTTNSYATTVTCTDNFVSATTSSSLISNDCDTSTLDSTKNWYYSIDYSLNVSSSDMGNNNSAYINAWTVPCPSSGSCWPNNYPNLGPLIFIPGTDSSFTLSSFRLISDSPSSRISYLAKSRFNSSITYDFSSFLTINSFTVSDDIPSGGSSVDPEEPDCPELPENPYDNKLDEIKYAIYAIGGVMLVIYFFYAIYKMIIGGSK